MDPRFIEILTKVYPLRYYDNIKSPTSVGFFKNQFLGELDQAVYWFDQALILSDDKGTVLSPVKRDFQNKNPDLLENNWVTQKPIVKKYLWRQIVKASLYTYIPVIYLQKLMFRV